MFLFIEDKEAICEQPCVNFEEPLTFKDAILNITKIAKWTSATSSHLVILNGFFSVACKDLTIAEKRGLERIALGRGACEIDTKAFTYTRFINKISSNDRNLSELIANIEISSKPQFVDRPGIGNFLKGNTLIVGDRPGPNAMGLNTPFVGIGSGLWLSKQMEEAGIDERKFYWINAKNNFGDVTPHDFVYELEPRRIIVLGGDAAFWPGVDCIDAVIKVSHPQYWRRFKSNEPYPLIRLMKNAK